MKLLVFLFFLTFMPALSFAEECPSALGQSLDAASFEEIEGQYPAVEEWLETAMVDSFSFAFNDYQELTRLALERYFTSAGQNTYNEIRSQMGPALQNQMLIQQFALLEEPALQDEGVVNGTYFWVYKVSGLLTWSGVNPVMDTKPTVFRVTVSRTNSPDHEHGLGIYSLKIINSQ